MRNRARLLPSALNVKRYAWQLASHFRMHHLTNEAICTSGTLSLPSKLRDGVSLAFVVD
jgi:hypothetical protein